MPGVNGWRWLRSLDDVTFALDILPDELGGALYAQFADGTALILVDKRLPRRVRHARLVHELTHHWFGVGAGVGSDERKIDQFVCDWLVPPGELDMIAVICDDGDPVMAWEVADAFDVPDSVAVQACERVHARRLGG